MKFTNNIYKATSIKPYNTDKGRYATPNEVAKDIIMQQLQNIYFDELEILSLMSDKEKIAVKKHLDKHINAIDNKLKATFLQSTNYKDIS